MCANNRIYTAILRRRHHHCCRLISFHPKSIPKQNARMMDGTRNRSTNTCSLTNRHPHSLTHSQTDNIHTHSHTQTNKLTHTNKHTHRRHRRWLPMLHGRRLLAKGREQRLGRSVGCRRHGSARGRPGRHCGTKRRHTHTQKERERAFEL